MEAMSPIKKIAHFFVRMLVDKNKELIHQETEFMGDFVHRLMNPENTGAGWTSEERKHLMRDLRHLSYYVPVLIIFLLPGGSLFLPLLAEALDRRRKTRSVRRKVSVSPSRL